MCFRSTPQSTSSFCFLPWLWLKVFFFVVPSFWNKAQFLVRPAWLIKVFLKNSKSFSLHLFNKNPLFSSTPSSFDSFSSKYAFSFFPPFLAQSLLCLSAPFFQTKPYLFVFSTCGLTEEFGFWRKFGYPPCAFKMCLCLTVEKWNPNLHM